MMRQRVDFRPSLVLKELLVNCRLPKVATPTGKRSLWLACAAFCLVVMLASRSATFAFEPARQFPDTRDRIRVFVDQLPGGISRAQMQFAARHYVGTQKLQAEQVDAIRAFNPKFIMLQYRMGTRQPELSVVFIHGNQWVHDWDEVNRHDDWFFHTKDSVPERVYMLYGNSREYLMDISGKVNGNLTDGWKEYWVRSVVADVKASHADGVFADSTHIPYNVPAKFHNSPLGPPPFLSYLPHLEAFYDHVYRELDRQNVYFIPNIGNLITGWDTTQGYYEDVHGAMVEGFAFRGNGDDWRLQQNNTLRLLRNGKIYLAQGGVAEADTQGRLWLLCNFLLLKHDRSYVNLLPGGHGLDSNLHWWPEYDLEFGAPVKAGVAKSVDELKSPSGVYYRRFEHGLVIVNPSNVRLGVDLGNAQRYQMVVPWGGGLVNSSGQYPRGGLKKVAVPTTVVVEPWSGMLLTPVKDL
jgi:hypothetical protein